MLVETLHSCNRKCQYQRAEEASHDSITNTTVEEMTLPIWTFNSRFLQEYVGPSREGQLYILSLNMCPGVGYIPDECSTHIEERKWNKFWTLSGSQSIKHCYTVYCSYI